MVENGCVYRVPVTRGVADAHPGQELGVDRQPRAAVVLGRGLDALRDCCSLRRGVGALLSLGRRNCDRSREDKWTDDKTMISFPRMTISFQAVMPREVPPLPSDRIDPTLRERVWGAAG